MALAAAQFHRMPSSSMTMLGVTGTNGKTTVTYLLDAMLRAAGRRTGLIGTVETRIRDEVRPSSHTTPESVDLQALLADMRDRSVECVSMEVSSHALQQQRVQGVRYAAAAFTQLTRDHLDYHGTMQAYFEAKARLFTEHLAAGGTAVLGPDAAGDRIASLLSGSARTVWRYGFDAAHDLRVEGLRLSLDGFSGTLVTPKGRADVQSPLVGEHNVLNALAAAGLALAAQIPLNAIARSLAAGAGAPGRLEPVADTAGRRLFVDYAHTDDALARVLGALRVQAPPSSRIVCVFGCGGDRDAGKRPLMGAAAARGADVVVVTSDNPRSESPEAIVGEIVPGLEGEGLRRIDEASARTARGYLSCIDRAEAIALALRLARPGDVVLVAGKGHETSQQVGAEKRPFDDREACRAALAEVNR
jgi:UDP-N-acetylmuramoyl-L-alanyl-D-glutamate--2,6-diaminopimelate ligase